jgi:outer membrane biosynthesis protein TonB
MPNVSIENLDKASVLKALHDASKAPEEERNFCPMSEAMAKRFIDAGQTRFDFVNRRALKFDLGASEFDATAYDELNGAGLAEKVVAGLRGPVAVVAEATAPEPALAETLPAPVPEPEAAPEPVPEPAVETVEAAAPESAPEPEPEPEVAPAPAESETEKAEPKTSAKRQTRKRS